MKGFCNNAILVLPKPESISKKGEAYLRELKKAIYNIRDFLKESDINLQCFSSDETGMDMNFEGIEYIHILTPEDRNFLNVVKISNTHRSGIDIKVEDGDVDIYNKVRSKFKVARGIANDERCDIIVKREKLAGKLYIASSRFVITFATKNNSYYPVTTKVGDKRLIFNIDNDLFTLTAKMSGEPRDILYLFKDERILTSVNKWDLRGDI